MRGTRTITPAARAATALVVAGAILSGTILSGTTRAAARQTIDPADSLRLNQLQFLGSHNSFHIAPDKGLFDFMGTVASSFGQDPKDLLYTHAPLAEQFQSQGVRQIELDIFADPDGGRYSAPVANLVEIFPEYAPDYEPWVQPALDAPGTKVLHIQDFDMKSTCLTLVSCLQQVKAFSDAHPTHVPIAILIEAKEDVLPDVPPINFVDPIPFTTALFDGVDAEIRSVFPDDQLFTPDDLRGSHTTLDEAVTTDGWPTLGALRGKVMFMLDNGGSAKANYLAGHPALEGRVLFTSANPGDPDAAFVKLNDPIGGATAIHDAVAAGYMVRTRADTPTDTIDTGDTTQRDAAFASGAQWVSTDFPVPGMSTALNSTYGMQFVDYAATLPGGGVARCNPVTAAGMCNFAITEPTTTTTTTTSTTTTTTPTSIPSTTISTTTPVSTTPLTATTTTDTTPATTPPGATTSTPGPLLPAAPVPAPPARPVTAAPRFTG